MEGEHEAQQALMATQRGSRVGEAFVEGADVCPRHAVPRCVGRLRVQGGVTSPGSCIARSCGWCLCAT